MNKTSFNTKLREYAVTKLSPTEKEKKLIFDVYSSFQELLSQNCLQIGSFPRFTTIRPIHDLDIIYVNGDWDENSHNPYDALKLLQTKINNEFKNPTNYQIETSLQTHSVSTLFKEGKDEIFSVDIVPGYKYSRNEFNQDTYEVPEITYLHQGMQRRDFYESMVLKHKEMLWVKSDPRGYIEIAKNVNQSNVDFRKTVKIIKAWKFSCENKDKYFKLKSFHLEQIVTQFFQNNPSVDIFDSIFNFFVELPEFINTPVFKDRADNTKYIDDYLLDLTQGQKESIIRARDCFLKRLEEFSPTDTIDLLVDACFYTRASNSEKFLFDYNIPTLLEDYYNFEISGEATRSGFREKILSKYGLIDIDKHINFFILGNAPNVDYFKWKVKNDNSSPEPRGEITDHHPRNVPEHTKYRGEHFVECYAIKDNVCVGKARQYVRLEYPH